MVRKDLQSIADHFRRSIPTYDEDAAVQRVVGENLIDLLDAYPDIRTQRVLEIGCCTGSMTELLCEKRELGALWVNDLVPECCSVTAERVTERVGSVQCIAGDITTAKIPDELDLVISSSTFQWLEDLPLCLDRLTEHLGAGGYLVFSMFGPGTMQQLRELIGVGLDYRSEEQIVELVQRNCDLKHVQSSTHRIYLESPRRVLRHIQQTGVGGLGDFRWTPSRLREFEREYSRRFGSEKGVPVDYVSISVVARKR